MKEKVIQELRLGTDEDGNLYVLSLGKTNPLRVPECLGKYDIEDIRVFQGVSPEAAVTFIYTIWVSEDEAYSFEPFDTGDVAIIHMYMEDGVRRRSFHKLIRWF